MLFHALRQACQAVSPRLEWVFPYGAPAIQAIFGEPHATSILVQLIFEHSRPAFLERQSLARIRNDSPSQRITVNEDVLHLNFPRENIRMVRRASFACREPAEFL
jgi:hypothetical protein